MHGLNSFTGVGTLAGTPTLRTRADGPSVCSGTLRIEEGRGSTRFRLFVPFDSYGPLSTEIAGLTGGDLVWLTGKLFWKKSANRQSGAEKSGLAVLVSRWGMLLPASEQKGEGGNDTIGPISHRSASLKTGHD